MEGKLDVDSLVRDAEKITKLTDTLNALRAAKKELTNEPVKVKVRFSLPHDSSAYFLSCVEDKFRQDVLLDTCERELTVLIEMVHFERQELIEKFSSIKGSDEKDN